MVWTCELVIPALMGFHVLQIQYVCFLCLDAFPFCVTAGYCHIYLILLCKVKMVSRDLCQESDCQRYHRFTVMALIVSDIVLSLLYQITSINQDLRRVDIVKMLHYFNSLCSILVYWVRIPHFKDAASTLVFCHKRRSQLPQGAVTSRSSSELRSASVSSSL